MVFREDDLALNGCQGKGDIAHQALQYLDVARGDLPQCNLNSSSLQPISGVHQY